MLLSHTVIKSSRKKLDLTLRVIDVILTLCTEMGNADLFSRNPLPNISNNSFEKVQQRQIDMDNLSNNWLLAEKQRDNKVSKLVADLNNKKLSSNLADIYELCYRYLWPICCQLINRHFRRKLHRKIIFNWHTCIR